MCPAKTPQSRTATRTIRLPIANRWRRKRLRAYAHWLLAFSSSPDSYESALSVSSGARSLGVPGWGRIWAPDAYRLSRRSTSGASGWPGSGGRETSVKANPRVEEAEHDVSNEIEEDDHHRRDHQPGHDLVRLAVAECVDEVPAHSREIGRAS